MTRRLAGTVILNGTDDEIIDDEHVQRVVNVVMVVAQRYASFRPT